MSARLQDFGDDVDVTLIMFSDPDDIDTYQHTHRLPLTIVIDRDRAAYRSFGMGRGTWWRVWGLRSWRRYAQIVLRDGRSGIRRPVDDTLQLGGDVVVDRDGIVAWRHEGQGPDDRPSVDRLLEVVDAVRRGTRPS